VHGKVTWVDTILGPGFPGGGTRNGDLATKTASQIDSHGTTVTVVANGCVTPGDGGGGVFYWSGSNAGGSTSITDDGGTLIVPDGTVGSHGEGWVRIYSAELSAKWFGATGNGSSDDTAALQNALNAAAGGTLFIPPGKYITTSTLSVSADTRIIGSGYSENTPGIWCKHNGDGLLSSSPINSSTAARIRIEKLGLSVDGSFQSTNTGGGIDNVGGTYFVVDTCVVVAFKYGIIFDQAECADILDCDLEANGTAGIWLVDGDDHTKGAEGEYTNRISIQRCQLNGGTIGILDDGGGDHRFSDCNFNGNTSYGIYVAGAEPALIESCEFEACGLCIYATYQTYNSHTGTGQSQLTIRSNLLAASVGNNCVQFVAGSPVYLEANLVAGSPTAYAFAGIANCFQVNAIGNVNDGPGGIQMFDSDPENGTVLSAGMQIQNGRQLTTGTAAPTSGTWNRGDVVQNTAPSSGGYAGWICMASGTPGTWAGYGVIA
jgi:hypothetical protein